MNNLVTSISSPLTFICALQSDCKEHFEEGVHLFYDLEDEESLKDSLISGLYEASAFYFTEHDTTAGGDSSTRNALRAFSVATTPAFYFLVRGKIYKYYGLYDVEAIVNTYLRLIEYARG